MSKTPGQIACEAHSAFLGIKCKDPFQPGSTHPDIAYLHQLWEHTANAIIEECAKVADDDEGKFTWAGEDRHVAMLQTCASEIASAIRSLKSGIQTPPKIMREDGNG